MLTHVSGATLSILAIFALLSIFVCTAQIFMRKKSQFLTLCKVSIFIPLVFVLIRTIWGMSLALKDIAEANDLSISIVHQGLSVLLASIAVGLLITIFLAVFYAITKAICENKKK